jgi:DNA polymerase I-like protein with 3'-5' exonuclease and polymerase domains
MYTKFGWTRQLLGRKAREEFLNESGKVRSIENSLQNFPMQSHGAEMLRLAIVYMSEMKLGVCAPLHDAVFLTCRIEDEERTVKLMRECMNKAAKNVIGAAVPLEVSVTRYPDRFVPEKKSTAVRTWARMMQLLEKIESEEETYV